MSDKIGHYQITAKGARFTRKEFPDGTPVPFIPKSEPKPDWDRRRMVYRTYKTGDTIAVRDVDAGLTTYKDLGLVRLLGLSSPTEAQSATKPAPQLVSGEETPKTGQDDGTKTDTEDDKAPALPANWRRMVYRTYKTDTEDDKAPALPANWRNLDATGIRNLAATISGLPIAKFNKERAIAYLESIETKED